MTALLALTLLKAVAADWHVTTNGTAAGQGTIESPWGLESALLGRHGVRPGDTIWIHGGVYRHPNRKFGAPGYEIRLEGSREKPIHIRALPGQRVTIDGGVNVQPPSTYLWLRDLEILVSENFTRSRRIEETGSSPSSYDRPWGGLNINSGIGCRFINLIIHDNAQGVSWWSGSTDSELHGCIIYDNGWTAPDRGHGHAIYTQNNEGLKTIADCILTGGYGYTLHAYGSSRADVNNYLVTGNVVYDAGPFLLGGGKPSHHIQVLTNFLHSVPMQLGYNAPTNADCTVQGNILVNSSLTINRFRQVVNEGNSILTKNDPRPAGSHVILRPNRYDTNRAHIIVLNGERQALVRCSLDGVLQPKDAYRILNPRDVFGKAILAGAYDGQSLSLPMTNEFAVFVLIKEPVFR